MLKPRQPVAFLLLAALPRAHAGGGGGRRRRQEEESDCLTCVPLFICINMDDDTHGYLLFSRH